MLEIANTEVSGWRAALRGMRNPMNSWDQSDTSFVREEAFIGPNDLRLAKRLAQAGRDHGKYLRMITVTCDVRGPLYWWKEFDTYKVGTVANSCSTMHKITAKEFTVDDFSVDLSEMGENVRAFFEDSLGVLEWFRVKYLKTKDKKYWRLMIQLLPESYMQRRTVLLNYAVLMEIFEARRGHKLSEWEEFRRWAADLPWFLDLTGAVL